MHSHDFGATQAIEYDIDTAKSPPVAKKPNNEPIARQKIGGQEIFEMMECALIQRSISSWSFRVVLIKKPDNSYRFTCDFKALNVVTVSDCYTLSRFSTVLQKLISLKMAGLN